MARPYTMEPSSPISIKAKIMIKDPNTGEIIEAKRNATNEVEALKEEIYKLRQEIQKLSRSSSRTDGVWAKVMSRLRRRRDKR